MYKSKHFEVSRVPHDHIYPHSPYLPPLEIFLFQHILKERFIRSWNKNDISQNYSVSVYEFRESVEFREFRIFSWNRANLHRPIRNKLLTARFLIPKLSNQSSTVIYRLQSHDNKVSSAWCTSISSTVCTLSAADYGTFDVLFQKQYVTNGWQQYSAGLEGNFWSLFFWLSQESSGEKKEFLFKVLVIGDLGVGKTSIIKRYVHQFFSVHYRATISFLKNNLNVT